MMVYNIKKDFKNVFYIKEDHTDGQTTKNRDFKMGTGTRT